MKKIKVAVAEDNSTYLAGLGALLKEQPDMEVVGLASNGPELLQMLKIEPADVVVMDIEMPMLSGIEVTRRISANWPETRVIGLTVHTTDEFVYQMLDAGAVAYVDKINPFEQITHAIRNSEKGKMLYAILRDYRLPQLPVGSSLPAEYTVFPFSEEDLKIIGGICDGLKREEIARLNCITVNQYNSRIRVIKEKMGVKTSSGIALYAFRNGLYKG